MKQIFLIPLFILFFLLASCDFGPNSGRGFSLPEGISTKAAQPLSSLNATPVIRSVTSSVLPGAKGPISTSSWAGKSLPSRPTAIW